MSTTQTHSDVLRILKQYISTQPFSLRFVHVVAHADDTKTWESCALKEKINVKVEDLAKKALMCAHATNTFFNGCYLDEDFIIKVRGTKITDQVKPALEEDWGGSTARHLLDCKGIVSGHDFETIWWSGVRDVMASYPKMFGVFVAKQVSGWCGSNSKRSLWDSSIANICPNCGKFKETSKHLTGAMTQDASSCSVKQRVLSFPAWNLCLSTLIL